MLQRLKSLYIGPSPVSDRGVFTGEDLKKGDILEICPVIILPREEGDWLRKSILYSYYFLWGSSLEQYAIALGYGSLYNHSFEPNCDFVTDYEERVVRFFCIKDIAAGDELLVNYVAGARREDLWFVDSAE